MSTALHQSASAGSVVARSARWLGPDSDPDWFRFSETALLEDREGRAVVLSKSAWYLERLQEKHPELVLNPTA